MPNKPQPQPMPSNSDDFDAALASSYDTGYQSSSAPEVFDDEIDLDDIPARLPAGTYDFEVVGAQASRSKSGAPQVILECEVMSGEFEGQHVREYMTFSTDGAKRYAASTLRSLLGPDVSLNTRTGALAQMLQGRTFRARTIVDEAGGYNTPKLDRIVGKARPSAEPPF